MNRHDIGWKDQRDQEQRERIGLVLEVAARASAFLLFFVVGIAFGHYLALTPY